MNNTVFLLAKDPANECRDIIYQRDGSLRIKVFCVGEKEFRPDPEELQFYGTNEGQTLAFQTQDYNYEEPGLIIEAIHWYANYIGNPDMEIEAEMHTHNQQPLSQQRK